MKWYLNEALIYFTVITLGAFEGLYICGMHNCMLVYVHMHVLCIVYVCHTCTHTHLMNLPNCTQCHSHSQHCKYVEGCSNTVEKDVHVTWQTEYAWEPCSEVATPEQCDCRPNEAQEQDSWHWHCMDKSCLLYQCPSKERELEENCHIGKMDEPHEGHGHHREVE